MDHTNLFAEALGQSPDAVLITDAELAAPGPIVRYANAAFCRLTGYAADEVIGRSPRMLQGPGTSRAVLDTLRAELSAGRHFLGATVNYRKDGTPFDIEWHVSPITSADGRVTHYLSVHRDVTGRNHHGTPLGDQASNLLDRLRRGEARTRELEAANAHLRALATTDGLTGLHNHRHFHDALAEVRRTGGVASLLMLDVDHFKSFNDAFGHPAGDAVLQAVAGVLKGCVRAEDTIARYGGEEFAILLPGRDEDHALAVAERVRAAVEAVAGLPRPVTVSVGVGTLRAGDGADRVLVDNADAALY
ncbi:MAG TPA: diguanylate cyclase, partial [Humisphaera sp.]